MSRRIETNLGDSDDGFGHILLIASFVELSNRAAIIFTNARRDEQPLIVRLVDSCRECRGTPPRSLRASLHVAPPNRNFRDIKCIDPARRLRRGVAPS